MYLMTLLHYYLHFRQNTASNDGIRREAFTRERVFEAASHGDSSQLAGLLHFLRVNEKRLTSPEFTGK